jgi:hypothetical protein
MNFSIKQPNQMNHFDTIPIELKTQILEYKWGDRNGILAQVCTEWKSIIQKHFFRDSHHLFYTNVDVAFESQSLMKMCPFVPSQVKLLDQLQNGTHTVNDFLKYGFPISSLILQHCIRVGDLSNIKNC